MSAGKVSFRIIGDSGPLSISWFKGPKGAAVESRSENGVGFFSLSGELLAVEFDDVEKSNDEQFLEFDHTTVSVSVKKGKVSFSKTERKRARDRF